MIQLLYLRGTIHEQIKDLNHRSERKEEQREKKKKTEERGEGGYATEVVGQSFPERTNLSLL